MGGRFLKICLSIFDINDPFPNVKSNLAKRFKESSVKKLFILGISPKVPEHYVNVKRLWINSDIDSRRRKYTVATDLKLCNIMLGMMSHSSLHPCCWCGIAKNNLKYKGNQRTILSLMSIFWNFFDARSQKRCETLW